MSENSASIAFVETECRVGGCFCNAWADWFQACEEADPEAFGEERDPRELEAFPFNPNECRDREKCPLYNRACPPHDDVAQGPPPRELKR